MRKFVELIASEINQQKENDNVKITPLYKGYTVNIYQDQNKPEDRYVELTKTFKDGDAECIRYHSIKLEDGEFTYLLGAIQDFITRCKNYVSKLAIEELGEDFNPSPLVENNGTSVLGT
jgi:hypothetical protein